MRRNITIAIVVVFALLAAIGGYLNTRSPESSYPPPQLRVVSSRGSQ